MLYNNADTAAPTAQTGGVILQEQQSPIMKFAQKEEITKKIVSWMNVFEVTCSLSVASFSGVRNTGYETPPLGGPLGEFTPPCEGPRGEFPLAIPVPVPVAVP